MLSKNEKEFLKNPDGFTKVQAKILRHRIRKKLYRIAEDLELILNSHHSSGIDITILARIIEPDRRLQNSATKLQKTETEKKDDLYYLENW